jgi:DNA adenine methylase
MDVANRLKNVQIDNRSAIDHIKKFDTKETLFYCDPPYLPDTRKSANDYKFEMDVDDHYQLAVVLNGIKGRAAISGYDSPLMGEFYQGWIKVKFKSAQVPMSRGSGLVRQECLWLNYKPSIQTELFS